MAPLRMRLTRGLQRVAPYVPRHPHYSNNWEEEFTQAITVRTPDASSSESVIDSTFSDPHSSSGEITVPNRNPTVNLKTAFSLTH